MELKKMCWQCFYGDICTCIIKNKDKKECKNKKDYNKKYVIKKSLKQLQNKALQYLENK